MLSGALYGIFKFIQQPHYSLAVARIEDGQKISVSEAKVNSYRSLEDLEKHADLIVRGIKTGGKEYIEASDIGTIMNATTDASIQVTEVIKGNVQINDMLTVVEPTAKFKGVISSLEGYRAMKINKEYILFLFKGTENKYGILAVNQGKYTTDNTVELYDDTDSVEYKRIKSFTEQVNGKYKRH